MIKFGVRDWIKVSGGASVVGAGGPGFRTRFAVGGVFEDEGVACTIGGEGPARVVLVGGFEDDAT